MTHILIIGGYGNFGQHIARRLSKDQNISLTIAGRSAEKAKSFAESIGASSIALDIEKDFEEALLTKKPDVVIHTSGPFQNQGYAVAEACIRHKSHYIDLADGREFVAGIQRLDQAARDAGVLVVSGASSVPCLTAAIIDHYLPQFGKLESIDYGIATAQRTNPGLATTAAILDYAGKPFTTLEDGAQKRIYGWQNLTSRKYPELGYRLLCNCDVPDLELFPARYKTLKNIRFRAGLEVPLLHMGLWALSWLARIKLFASLKPFASAFYNIGPWFNIFGTDRSGFHMEMKGDSAQGTPLTKIFYIITGAGHGPNIPCIPSILLAQMLAKQDIRRTGATACVDLITLGEYKTALSEYDIRFIEA